MNRIVSIILLIIAVGCSESDNNKATPKLHKQVKMTSYDLEDLGLSISLDSNISVSKYENGYLFQDISRVYSRNPRSFRLFTAVGSEAYQDHVENSGVLIQYTLQNRHEGSSGKETYTTGKVTLNKTGKEVGFSCHDISESTPDGKWCFPYLLSLRAI